MSLSPYRIRSADVWAQAREDYLAGMPAEAVCRRHDLGLSAFRRRARRHGWRRLDQDAPAGAEDLSLYDDLGLDDQMETARRRYLQALEQGRSVDAARWRRLWRELEAENHALIADLYRGLAPAEIADLRQADRLEFEAAEAEEDAALSLGPVVPPSLPGPDATPQNVHDVHPVFSSAQISEAQPAPNDALRNNTRAAP
jgi:hypothetical protein